MLKESISFNYLKKILRDSLKTNVDEDLFDDPNRSIRKCPKCGSPMKYDGHSMVYKCSRCLYFERGRSRF